MTGHIYQYPFHNCSRNSLKNKKLKKTIAHIKEAHGNIPIISFKSYVLDTLYFWNTEGRARALRYECNVYIYSDFPVEQAEYIMDDYLSGNTLDDLFSLS